jgi:hypothetical protein
MAPAIKGGKKPAGAKKGVFGSVKGWFSTTFFEKTDAAKKNKKTFWNVAMFGTIVGLVYNFGDVLDPSPVAEN